MTSDAPVILAILGVLGTCVGGLIWVIKRLFERVVPAMDNISIALEKLSTSTESNTRAIKAADTYLQKRNGATDKHHANVTKAVKAVSDTVNKAVSKCASPERG